MRRALVRAAALVSLALLALACQSTAPSAPEEPAGPTTGLGLSAPSCDGKAATHVLVPGGPGTDGSWFVGTGGKDVIVGTDGNDKIDGASGADRICGRAGDDEILGGSASDRLFGGPGTDRLDGGLDHDWLDGGADDDVLDGGDGKDKLFGGGGPDSLRGGNQNDQLAGGAGDDVLFGDADNDALDGGPATDECVGGGQPWDTTINCEGAPALLQLVAGRFHTCALTSAGAAYCWGDDTYGQLGDGTVGPNNATPVAVTGGHTFVSLAAGSYHTCGVRTDGAAYCWGWDDNGRLGDGTVGTPAENPTPLAVTGGHSFASLTAGFYHTCGVRSTDSAAYCWGWDAYGQVGDGTLGTPDDNPTPVAVAGGHTWASLDAGDLHTCGVRSTDGAAYCWGNDQYGQLGDGAEGGYSATPGVVTGGHTWASLAAGNLHTCGVRSTDGAAYCWGSDAEGQLGDGTAGVSSATPGAVTGGHTWTSLATGGYHTCGVRTDGAAYCWGDDEFGQLGDGTAGPTSATPGAVTGGDTFASLAAGLYHTCGVRTDGAAYCWGYDGQGQRGDGTVGTSNENPTPGAVVSLP